MAAMKWLVEVLPFVPVTQMVENGSAQGNAAGTGRAMPTKVTGGGYHHG
jgi:hypothetical protein